MAHLIQVYELNKAEDQNDKSKMFQIVKFEIYQFYRIGVKFYSTQTSPKPPSEKKAEAQIQKVSQIRQ